MEMESGAGRGNMPAHESPPRPSWPERANATYRLETCSLKAGRLNQTYLNEPFRSSTFDTRARRAPASMVTCWGGTAVGKALAMSSRLAVSLP